jgi:TPR repeat protein
MYKSGIGVPVDESLALHYYTLAKDRNEHAKAMHDSLLATAVAAPASTSTSTPAKTPGWREKLGRWWND